MPSDCNQVRRSLRSTQADAARGQDRRALVLSTGPPAAGAASRDAAGGIGEGSSMAARPLADPAVGTGVTLDIA